MTEMTDVEKIIAFLNQPRVPPARLREEIAILIAGILLDACDAYSHMGAVDHVGGYDDSRCRRARDAIEKCAKVIDHD